MESVNTLRYHELVVLELVFGVAPSFRVSACDPKSDRR